MPVSYNTLSQWMLDYIPIQKRQLCTAALPTQSRTMSKDSVKHKPIFLDGAVGKSSVPSADEAFLDTKQ